MESLLKELIPYFRETARRFARYPEEYTAQCRRADRAYRMLWKSFTKKQKELYLHCEAEYNARCTMEEEQLIRRVFTVAKELYR